MNASTSVGKRLQNLEIGNEFDVYTRVILHVGQITDADGNTTDLDYIAGNTTGRTLEVSDPFGTQAKANAMLARLQNSKWQYQPARMDKALLDPAAELGDGISASDIFTAIYKRKTVFSSLMASDVEAPTDEEIDHEYKYIPKADRQWKRETAYTRTQLRLNENAIRAEVASRTAQGERLQTSINLTNQTITQEVTRSDAKNNSQDATLSLHATQIAAKVESNTEGKKSSFGWKLTATDWSLWANNSRVLFVNKDGLEVSGKVTATSGSIGGISLSKDYGLYTNGKTTATSTASGFLIHKNGAIYLGPYNSTYKACPFQVTSSGVLTANSGTIGGISMNRSYGLYTNGKTSATSPNTGFFISNNGAIYLGPYNSTTKACPFQVTSSGALTATSGKIGGFTISASSIYNGKSGVSSDSSAGVFLGTSGIAVGQDATHLFKVTNTGAITVKYGKSSRTDGNTGVYIGTDGIALGAGNFQVTNAGAVTAKNLTITGGSISIGKDANNNPVFEVTNAGKVTARNLVLANGLSIGSNFSADYNGNVTANNMTLKGTLKIYNEQGTSYESYSAENLKLGAQRANNGYSGWNSTKTTVDDNNGHWSDAYDWTDANGSDCVEGSGYGFNYNSAAQSYANGPEYFTCGSIGVRGSGTYYYFSRGITITVGGRSYTVLGFEN